MVQCHFFPHENTDVRTNLQSVAGMAAGLGEKSHRVQAATRIHPGVEDEEIAMTHAGHVGRHHQRLNDLQLESDGGNMQIFQPHKGIKSEKWKIWKKGKFVCTWKKMPWLRYSCSSERPK